MISFDKSCNSDNTDIQIKEALGKIICQTTEDSGEYSLNYRKAYFTMAHSISNCLDMIEKSIDNGKEIPNKHIYVALVSILNAAEDICIDEDIEAMENSQKMIELDLLAQQIADYLQG